METCKTAVVRTRDHEEHHDDDARPEGKSSVKCQKTSEHGTFTMEREMTSNAIQRMHNSINVMMRDRCNSCEEHQYHLDQMKSYMENQNVWESREEDLTVQILKKPALIYLSCARNPKIPQMSLVNQYLFYLKYGKSGTRKYIPSLHKIHVVLFSKDDLEELNTRWVKKIIKRFNHYSLSSPAVQNSLAGATQQLSSGNTSSLAVGKYSSSGIFITSSGNDLSILFLTYYSPILVIFTSTSAPPIQTTITPL
nr:hypothetical protein [Tanacetum cinerariifolium]